MSTLINPAKVATVTVVHGDDKITVKSVKATLTIDFTVLGVEYTREERDLFTRIERGPSPRSMELTYADLAAFKAAHDRVKAMEDVGTLPIASVDRVDSCKPQTVEAPAPAPAPAPVQVIAPVAGPAPLHYAGPAPTQEVQGSFERIASRFVATVAHTTEASHMVAHDEAQSAERHIRMLEEAVRLLTENGLVTVSYDIPDVSKAKVSQTKRKLMKLGFLPLEKSKFLGLDKVTKSPQFRAMAELWARNRVTFHVLPLHDSIGAMMREEGKETLIKEIRREHNSLINNIGSAADRIAQVRAEVLADESKGTKELEESEGKEHNAMRAHIRKACESLETCIKLAELYDANECTDDLVASFKAAIRSQAESFNAMARSKRIKLAPMPS